MNDLLPYMQLEYAYYYYTANLIALFNSIGCQGDVPHNTVTSKSYGQRFKHNPYTYAVLEILQNHFAAQNSKIKKIRCMSQVKTSFYQNS